MSTGPAKVLRAMRERRWMRAVAANAKRDTRPPLPSQFARWGAGSVIVPPSRVSRPDCVEVGRNVVLHEGAWLSVVEAHEGHPPRLVLGDGVRFGRSLSVACIGEILIEDDVMGSDDVFVADCYHGYEDPDTPVLYQPMSWPRPVRIGTGAYLGAGCIVLPGVTVGAGAYLGEGSVVTKDVPARAVVFGNPARVVHLSGAAT